jgi:hypothetical protein
VPGRFRLRLSASLTHPTRLGQCAAVKVIAISVALYGLLADPPVDLPRNRVERVHRAETAEELAAVRESVIRGAPFGSPAWRTRTVAALGLEAALRPRGRPRRGSGN